MRRLLVCVVLVVASCGSDATSDAPAAVVTTTDLWADVVDNMVCGSVSVDALLPAGADPHVFEASLADRRRLDEATLVVANGLGLEGTLDDTLEAVEEGGGTVVRVGDLVDTITVGGGSDADPHVWLDPQRVADALPALGDVLIAAGLDDVTVGECTASYVAELRDLDSEIEALVATLAAADRLLVTSHDALGYFADRYGFDVIGTVISGGSSLGSANPAELDALVDTIDLAGVTVVFADNHSSTTDVEAVAREAGVDIVLLSIANLDDVAPGYVDLLRNTARRIVTGSTG